MVIGRDARNAKRQWGRQPRTKVAHETVSDTYGLRRIC